VTTCWSLKGGSRRGNGCSSPHIGRRRVAALQTGLALGAKVIGTSGSAEKLEKLKAMGLDVASARAPGFFAEAVMKATGGKGANLVVKQRRRIDVRRDDPRACLRGPARDRRLRRWSF